MAAQSGKTDMVLPDKVYPAIESCLEQFGDDSVRHFILQQLRNYCGKDDNCQYQACRGIMDKLEDNFNLPLAIFVGEEMLKLAQRQGDLRKEATTYGHLYRYHDALGNRRLAFKNSEKALSLFKLLGDDKSIAITQMAMLEFNLSFRKFQDVLPEMEALLNQVIAKNDTFNAAQIHIRIVQLSRDAGLYDKMEEHVTALEKIPFSIPIKTSEYYYVIFAAMSRGDLLKHQGKLTEAEPFYQRALRLCEDAPDRWLEIKILYSLSDLEWERGNVLTTKSYLSKAQQKAENMHLDELLASIFELKAKIAEAERHYADALAFTKKQQFHEKNYKSQSAGFNIESYYLQQEKEQLATQQRNQELELQIKKTQLRYSLLISALVILLTIGLLASLKGQRKSKQELAAQNALIQQQAEQLKSLDAAKSRFFANVSHELRTPLSLMLGPIQSVLQESNLSEKQIRLLNTAHQSGKGLQILVNEILDLQKLEMSKMEIHAEPTRLSAFFNRYAAQFESLAQSRKIDFRHEAILSEDVVANIDREKCRQILSNLVSNALKFTPAGGWVEFNYSLQGNKLHLKVSDSGHGIPPEDLHRVFDRYFQSSSPGKPAEGGTGIGLALCQEYAKLFGGNISVESKVGKGSVFSVEFPVTLADPSQMPQVGTTPEALETDGIPHSSVEATTVASPKKNTSRKAILVVEDNLELQEYIRLILAEKFQVITAGNGQEALKVAQNVDLILSDLMMPVMDGYELLEKLKSGEATRTIPVIMLTARAEAKDRLKALRIGVDDYLTKPFDEEELLVRMENLLANSRNRQMAVKEDLQEPLSSHSHDGPNVSETDRAWLEAFEAFVQKNLASSLLSIPYLAREFAMSESTLLRQLKRLTGLTTVQYLQEIRLHQARQLLENRNYNTLARVVSQVGYDDISTFSKVFKQRYGKSPSDYISD